MINKQPKYSIEIALNISNSDIYKRGKEYFNQGRVIKTWKEKNKDLALVQGADTYEVALYFDGDCELVSKCSCPYEDGDICKHIVAVILSLSNIKVTNNKKVESKENITDYVSNLNLKDAQEFISRIAIGNTEITKSLKVFVQGQKESPIKTEDYYTKFKKELSQISPESLLESFHFFEQQNDYDDYWDNDSGYDDDNDLSEWVNEIIDLVSKYFDNNNFKEALKIYFSAIQAYFERSSEIEVKYSELGDWIEVAGNKLLEHINTYLNKLPKKHLGLVVTKLKEFVKSKIFETHKSDFLVMLSDLYFKFGEITKLEGLVEKYISFYPPISFNLLSCLKQEKKFKELRLLSKKVLSLIPKKDDFFSFRPSNYYDKEEFEIKVRRILIDTFDTKKEYKLLTQNLERLFEISKETDDYKRLREKYKNSEEKTLFLEKIESEFKKQEDISELFSVFRVENNKLKVLGLVQKYKEDGSFSEMVEFVKDKFPAQCFLAYKSKIDKLLEVADTYKYEIICKDLLNMR
ncbi:MAG: SWIM zinc finger family protein [Patescibacteria group bacterium]